MYPEITIPQSLDEALEALAENMLASESFAYYHAAAVQYEQDPDAKLLIEALSQKQANIRANQATGNLTQQDIDSLRSLQEQVNGHPVMVNYFTKQQEAVNFLREINQEINELLGLDFAQLAQRSTC
jgi:cell fate (sporulation/competence/biofilm development) regulator YlbF (YheA/YmcA/DUF963 family)